MADDRAPLPKAVDAAEGERAPGEGWKLVAGWLVVGIPAAWGVAQVVVKSLALFR